MGVQDALEGRPVELRIFYLDTKRNTSQDWKVKKAREAWQVIDSWQPDAVVTADDNAQILVTQHYAGEPGPYFVFCGVNGKPEAYNIIAPNVTGVLERPHFEESIEYLREILPRVHRIAIISDLGPTSMGALDYMSGRAVPGVDVLGIHLIEKMSVWQERFSDYDHRDFDAVAVYMYHTLKTEEGGRSIDPEKVMDWTIGNIDLPLVGFFDFAVADGMLCGVVESGHEHGYDAGRMAWELVNGTDIRELPIHVAERGVRMLNLRTAEILGIDVPEDVISNTDRLVR
ncbi:MAG: ABC transporter substrate-binding protein [Candidatus Omnitrophota bacterium]